MRSRGSVVERWPFGQITAALFVCVAVASAYGCGGGAAESRFEGSRRLMGVPWTITVHAASKERAEAAIDAAFGEVARLERIFSDYDPNSELSLLSAKSPTVAAVGDDLWKVLQRAAWFRDKSGGSFDPTIGPLTTLWRQARRSGRLPAQEKLATALAAVGPETLRLDPEARSVELRRAGMRLDLGGIGMGYAVDAAMAVLGRHGIRSAMIDASGDIAVSGPPPGKTAWRIVVEPLRGGRPREAGGQADEALTESAGTESANAASTSTQSAGTASTRTAAIELVDAAVTTSGDAFQAVEIDGVRYSHVVDSRTGLGVKGPTAVTVIAADCTTADAAATAASVLGPEAGEAFVESLPRASARFQWLEKGELRTRSTRGWPSRP